MWKAMVFICLTFDLHLAEPKLSKPLDSSTYCCSPNLGRDDVDDVDGDVGDDVDGDDVDGDIGVWDATDHHQGDT